MLTYAYLDDLTLMTKVAELSKSERFNLEESSLARTDTAGGRSFTFNFNDTRVFRWPVEDIMETINYFLSLVGTLRIKVYLNHRGTLAEEAPEKLIELLQEFSVRYKKKHLALTIDEFDFDLD